MTLNSDVGGAIKRLIAARGWSLREAARIMGRSHNWLGGKIRGQSPLDLGDLEEMGAALGFDPIEMLTQALPDHVD